MLAIGIDPGVNTGFGVWDSEAKKLTQVSTLLIHQAMREVIRMHEAHHDLVVIFEDARKRQWFGNADARQAKYGAAIREGVGSVKRDCTIWEDFLSDTAIAWIARLPLAGGTKWKSDLFARSTGWTARSSEHARDAAMLVYGLPTPAIAAMRLSWQREAVRANASTGT